VFSIYLVTGATGNLGREIVRTLLGRGARVRALVMPGDRAAAGLPGDVRVFRGDVADEASLSAFFEGELSQACLIHCAGLISIASQAPPTLRQVNVEGTRNVLSACRAHGVGRVIYVSSVHALPEGERGAAIRETDAFSPDPVRGHYAKSKAEATAIALLAAREGLNLSVVHPSGILSPDDAGRGHTASVILSYCRGGLPFAAAGGYDFVDVRDVAEGILACAARGRAGECYILSGHYATLRDILGHVRRRIGGRRVVCLPLGLLRLLAPAFERYSLLRKRPLFLTPYSVYTLGSNAVFSHDRATAELGYQPRALADTLDDILAAFSGKQLIGRERGKK